WPVLLIDSFWRREQSPQSSSQVGRAREIRLIPFTLAPQGKHARSSRNAAQNFFGSSGEKLDAMGEIKGRAHSENCSRTKVSLLFWLVIPALSGAEGERTCFLPFFA